MSDERDRKIIPRILVCIVPTNREKRMRTVFRDERIPVFYECYGHGTAPSEVLDILGIGESGRLMTMTFVPQSRVHELIGKINGSMSLREKGSGISFTIPITAMQAQVLETMKQAQPGQEESKSVVRKFVRAGKEKAQEEEESMKDNAEYALIWASVTKGYADEVVNAARGAGARGGTVLRGNRRGDDEITQQIGIPQQSEQEIVLILTAKEQKRAIMEAITAACGLSTPACGIVISLPVDEVMGITA